MKTKRPLFSLSSSLVISSPASSLATSSPVSFLRSIKSLSLISRTKILFIYVVATLGLTNITTANHHHNTKDSALQQSHVLSDLIHALHHKGHMVSSSIPKWFIGSHVFEVRHNNGVTHHIHSICAKNSHNFNENHPHSILNIIGLKLHETTAPQVRYFHSSRGVNTVSAKDSHDFNENHSSSIIKAIKGRLGSGGRYGVDSHDGKKSGGYRVDSHSPGSGGGSGWNE